MLKTVRQNTILELVEKNEIETQEELVRKLNENGFNVTQATVSRDIKELKLVKSLTETGVYKYAPSEPARGENIDLYIKMFRDTVKSMEQAMNLIVIHTIAGSANVAAETIDKLGISEIAGTLAGDNTIFVATRDEKSAADILKRFRQMLR